MFLRGWYARMTLRILRKVTKDGMEEAKARGVVLGRPPWRPPWRCQTPCRSRRCGRAVLGGSGSPTAWGDPLGGAGVAATRE